MSNVNHEKTSKRVIIMYIFSRNDFVKFLQDPQTTKWWPNSNNNKQIMYEIPLTHNWWSHIAKTLKKYKKLKKKKSSLPKENHLH